MYVGREFGKLTGLLQTGQVDDDLQVGPSSFWSAVHQLLELQAAQLSPKLFA